MCLQIPADNSCLFNSVAYAMDGANGIRDRMKQDLRSFSKYTDLLVLIFEKHAWVLIKTPLS